MKYDSWQPPSRPHTTFPDTREHGSTTAAKVSTQGLERQDRSSVWFSLKRHGGSVILHHRHIRPVLVRAWSRPMEGITAAIWASGTTIAVGRQILSGRDRPQQAHTDAVRPAHGPLRSLR